MARRLIGSITDIKDHRTHDPKFGKAGNKRPWVAAFDSVPLAGALAG